MAPSDCPSLSRHWAPLRPASSMTRRIGSNTPGRAGRTGASNILPGRRPGCAHGGDRIWKRQESCPRQHSLRLVDSMTAATAKPAMSSSPPACGERAFALLFPGAGRRNGRFTWATTVRLLDARSRPTLFPAASKPSFRGVRHATTDTPS